MQILTAVLKQTGGTVYEQAYLKLEITTMPHLFDLDKVNIDTRTYT